VSARPFLFGFALSLVVLVTNGQQRDMHDYLGLGSPPDVAAAERGEPLYKQNCAACHGENARGAQGPNLVRSRLVLHDEKGSDIGEVVKNGRPEAGMPAFPNLTKEQIYDIAEYLHLQVEKAANRGLYDSLYVKQRTQSSGDPVKGKQFFDAHCANCHSPSGDLAKIGEKYPDVPGMQEHFIWPRSRREALQGSVTTTSGEIIQGTIVKIDDFDITLRDSSGETHHWPRDQVQVKIDDKLAGHRALLPVYTDADLHNVTAYLLTLK
jgi:mono/diheme cytochrome c family protein